MKKFVVLPILFLILALSGCTNIYLDEQDNTLNQTNIDVEKTQDNFEDGQQKTGGHENLSESAPVIQTYTNLDFSYAISYPLSWQTPVFSGLGKSNFEIQNIADAYSTSQMESILNSNGSIFSIVVLDSLNNINFADYSAIDDLISNPEYISPSSAADRLFLVSEIEIGGKNLRVFKVGDNKSQKLEFIYNGKHYTISFRSGGESQYLSDSEVFENVLLSSFTLL